MIFSGLYENINEKMIISNLNYYTYLGTHYHMSFPLKWAMNQKDETGIYCENCLSYATERNCLGERVHMGYCLNCATHTYENERKAYHNIEERIEEAPELTPEPEEYEEEYQETPWYRNGYDSY